MSYEKPIKVHGTKDGKLYIQPEDLFARRDVKRTIKRASKLPFHVYDPEPEAKALLEKYEPIVVVKSLLSQLKAARQTAMINNQMPNQ